MFSCWGKSIPSKIHANLSTQHFHETWRWDYWETRQVSPVISDPSHNREKHNVYLSVTLPWSWGWRSVWGEGTCLQKTIFLLTNSMCRGDLQLRFYSFPHKAKKKHSLHLFAEKHFPFSHCQIKEVSYHFWPRKFTSQFASVKNLNISSQIWIIPKDSVREGSALR